MLLMKTNGQHFTSQLMNGHVDVAKVLIQNGADVKWWTTLHFAAEKGHVDVAKVLIQNGADVNAVDDKETALHFAAQKWTC